MAAETVLVDDLLGLRTNHRRDGEQCDCTTHRPQDVLRRTAHDSPRIIAPACGHCPALSTRFEFNGRSSRHVLCDLRKTLESAHDDTCVSATWARPGSGKVEIPNRRGMRKATHSGI